MAILPEELTNSENYFITRLFDDGSEIKLQEFCLNRNFLVNSILCSNAVLSEKTQGAQPSV